MKKKIAIFACTVALLLAFTVICFAEGEGGGEDLAWNLWDLLSFKNVNYLGIIGTLITTVVTFLKILGGGSNVGESIKNAIIGFLDFLRG